MAVCLLFNSVNCYCINLRLFKTFIVLIKPLPFSPIKSFCLVLAIMADYSHICHNCRDVVKYVREDEKRHQPGGFYIQPLVSFPNIFENQLSFNMVTMDFFSSMIYMALQIIYTIILFISAYINFAHFVRLIYECIIPSTDNE